MKKKNLATAMAAAMAFGGVAPVVAHANEPQGRTIVEGENKVVNVATANGRKITTDATYRDVYNTNFTQETKDDEFKDASTKILAIMAGTTVVSRPSTVDATDGLKIAYTVEDKTLKAEDIAQAKANLEDTKAEIERLLSLQITVDGKKVNAYTVDKANTKIVIKGGQPVYEVKLNPAEKSGLNVKNFAFTGVVAPITVDNSFNVVESIDLTTTKVTTGGTYEVKELKELNTYVYELKTAIKAGKITVSKSESTNGSDLILTIKSNDTANDTGRTTTLKNFVQFKEAKYAGFVDMFEMKDLANLDLPELSWAKEDILNALASGKINGDERGFRPQDSITRAEFAKMIVTLGNVTVEKEAKETFTDVDGEWFAPYVAILETKGIVEGDGDGTFRPYDAITRQEAAVMIAAMKTADNKKVDQFNATTGKAIDSITKFNDDKAIELWADGAVKYLQDAEISRGDENKNFNPANNITRAESVVMITKATTAGVANLETVTK